MTVHLSRVIDCDGPRLMTDHLQMEQMYELPLGSLCSSRSKRVTQM